MITLGIDIGTTKSAAVICEDGKLLAHFSGVHHAGYGSQSTEKLIDSAADAVNALPESLRKKVSAIGITGQMHGVVAWDNSGCSELENWQSDLALKSGTLERIKSLPGCGKLASGFGFSTLAVPGWLGSYRHAATIMDYFASLLAGRENAMTAPANAASWGLWLDDSQDWNRDAIRALEIPEDILPEIVPDGTVTGKLCKTWSEKLGLSAGIPIYVPVGDNPAAIIGSGGNPETDLYLTVGTGAQLAFIPSGYEQDGCPGLEIRPFHGKREIAISSSLCGGKSLELLADFIKDILHQFSVDLPREAIYKKISEEADSPQGLAVKNSFMGERSDPFLCGSISGISMENLRFHPLCRAWYEGVLNSLLANIPSTVLKSRKRIIVNGNAIRRSPLFQSVIRETFPGMELVLPELCEEAACGAAILAEAGLGQSAIQPF